MIDFPYRREIKRLTATEREHLPGQYIQLSDGVTQYEFVGPEDGEICVLVHGFSVPYFIWDFTFEFLAAQGYRVLRYNLYGRGFSDRPLLPNTPDLFVRQLDEILQALSISEPVNLFGLSTGGVITGHFTVRHPERVKRLLLFDPAGFQMETTPVMRLINVPYLGEVLMDWFGDRVMEKGLQADSYDPAMVAEIMRQYRPQMAYRGFRASLLSTLREKTLEAGLRVYQKVGSELQMPVFLVWGEEDTTVPFKHHQELVGRQT